MYSARNPGPRARSSDCSIAATMHKSTFLSLSRWAVGVALVAAAACHGGDGAATSPDGAPPVCTFGPPLTGRLPHVHATGAQAQAVVQVVESIFAAQKPPLPTDRHRYDLPSV